MAEIAICSLVRNAMEYLPAYRRQLESLSVGDGLDWQLYILEGDSSDDSYGFLKRWSDEDPRVHIGQEHVGVSTEKEGRAARWARAGNACFDLVPSAGEHTHVLWLEADLCFPAELLARLVARDVDVVAPIIWLGGLFYDTWGFRGTDGVAWTNASPYHADYRPMTLLEMSSVGSCVLFERAVLDAGIRFRPSLDEGLLVGMCKDARDRGFRVWADTATAILHPVANWEAQLWRCNGIELIDGQLPSAKLEAYRENAARSGYRPARMEPELVRGAHRSLFKSLCKDLHTNRLEVEVRAREEPHRSYDLHIRCLAPDRSGPVETLRSLARRAFGATGSPIRIDVRIVLEK